MCGIIFQYYDPNIVPNFIQCELNSIVELIAPTKIIQLSKSQIQYQSKESTDKLKVRQQLHDKSISTNNIEDWREFRNYRNKLSKEIRKERTVPQREI